MQDIVTPGKLRVCQVCSMHPDDDARVFDRACVSLAEEGYDVRLVARSAHSDVYRNKGVRVHPVPKFESRHARLLGAGRVARLAAGVNPDIFHVHEPELLSAVLSVARGRPVIWDVHEPYLDNVATKPWIPLPLRPLVRVIWDRFEKRLVRRCAAVVVATEWLAPRYDGLHSVVVVVANYPRLRPVPVKPAKPPRRNALVFTGTMTEDRGLLQTLEAMSILAARGIPVTFEVAGRPTSAAFLEEFNLAAERFGVRAQVHYHGYLPRDRALELQAGCGIGMNNSFPSPGHVKGFPVKMLEFMNMGLPVIFGDMPNMRRLAGETGAGLAVDPASPRQIADAIMRLLADPELARRMGEAGKKAVLERFNWEVEWPKLKALYERLLVTRPGG